MATRERPADRGDRLARRDTGRLGADIRTARLSLGRSLEWVARIARMSRATAGRVERGECLDASAMARCGAAVGIDVRISGYPGAEPVRDAPQLRTMARLRGTLHPGLRLETEVVLPIPGDQRAWDGRIDGLAPGQDGSTRLYIECETRLVDCQAQIRRIMLKARDTPTNHVLLLVANTQRNRAAVRLAEAVLHDAFPINARAALRDLRAGRHPGGSALVFL